MANALSINYDGVTNCIVTDVEITNPFTGEKTGASGIWDTGATNSAITEKMARQLNLVPISKCDVMGVHGINTVNIYTVIVSLNNKQITVNINVTEAKKLSANDDIGMLIGMDIITMGDFCVTNTDGKTSMSFIRPSQKRIDFVEDINKYNEMLKKHNFQLTQGNNKCPCGSGKKWENCHGKIIFKD